MELVLRYLCLIILLQSVTCELDNDIILDVISSRLAHISISLARIARKQRVMETRLDSITANMKDHDLTDGKQEDVESDYSDEEAKEELLIMKRAISSEKEYVRNLVESISVDTGDRIASVKATSDDLAGRITAVEATSDNLGGRVTAVEVASDDFGGRITAVEATSDDLGRRIAADKATSDDLGKRIAAVEATADDLSGRIAAVKGSSVDLSRRIQSMEKGMAIVEATSGGLGTRVDSMESSIASLVSAAERHVSFSVQYRPEGNHAILKKGTTIKFNHVFYNDGSGYDKTTGIFTVPVSGVYQFIFFIEGWQKKDEFICQAATVVLYVDGSAAGTAAIADPRDHNQIVQAGNAYINYLSKGQVVKLRTGTSCDEHIIYSHRTTFSGVLLY
ncbi:uncharacterized protein LOC123526476 [Mercenaria mercenaria]|uniref:uncharacterized protein LOC123526476 n=1 Tax=Mercenaria mercenaria TaxID=6596 RepID=UPI00234ECD7D|nr:uncharacterized protein LOC123526476 [Mercenaria mercenaria]